MGIGFPRRPLRSAFGPKLTNAYPVEHPETQVGAQSFNPDFWQTAGMGLIVPRAIVIAKWNGSAFDIYHQAEAWNPNGDQAHPVLARTGAGLFTYTFAASYLDEDGNEVPTDIRAARCTGGDDNGGGSPRRGYGWILTASPLVARFRLVNETLTGQDELFWGEVF